MLNPYKRYVSEEKYIVGQRELAGGEHSFRARCESNIRGRFASLFRIVISVERPLHFSRHELMDWRGVDYF